MNVKPKRTLAIGVTGGIGSGKSEVCALFQSLGGKVYSSDGIAKELTNSDAKVKRRIVQEFGPEMYKPDGTLDRKAMAKLIFSDESAKEKINAIVHPVVIDHIAKLIATAKKAAVPSMLFIESALIYEAEIDEMFDYVILVVSEDNSRIDRVMKRDSVTRNEVLQRQAAQSPADKFREDADFVIENNRDLQQLKSNCTFIYSILCQSGPA